MAKVIAINGSKRKQNTYRTLKKIEELLKTQNIDMEVINLFDYEIKDCIGCVKCIEKDKCVYQGKDQVEELMDKLKGCDGIILASPVYMKNISGRLKVFIDRTCSWYHRSEIYGKPSFCVATTAGSGLTQTLDYLEEVARQWGTLPTGRIGLKTQTMGREITLKELQKFIKIIQEGNSQYKPTLKQLTDYQIQKVLSMKILTTDKAYWVEKGWDKQDFFIHCKISWPKKVVAKGFYNFLSRVIQPKAE